MQQNEDEIKRIIEHYGINKQMMKAIEEMSQLTKELYKFLIKDKFDDTGIIEEIADVELMLERLKYICDCAESVEGIKARKIKRTLDKIKSVKKGAKMIKNDANGRKELFNSIKSAIEDSTGLIFKIDTDGNIIRAYDYFGEEITLQSVGMDNIVAMIKDLAVLFKRVGC